MLKLTPFAHADEASINSLFGVASQALRGAEQLIALNLQATKTMVAEFAEIIRATLSEKSPAELGKLQIAALQAAPEKALAYGRQVKDIFAAATAGQRAAVEAQVADVQAKFLEAVKAALQNVPGSENTLVLVQSAVAAANNAYEGVSKASKQVSEALDANVTKITKAGRATRSRRSTPELDKLSPTSPNVAFRMSLGRDRKIGPPFRRLPNSCRGGLH